MTQTFPTLDQNLSQTQINANFWSALQALQSGFSGASAPSSPVDGQFWFDTGTGLLKVRYSSSWVELGPMSQPHTIREVVAYRGALAGSITIPLVAPYGNSRALDVYLISDTATTGSSGANRWEFQVANADAATNLLATSKKTDTAEIAIGTLYKITPDQNQDVTADQRLQLVITKTGTPTSLSAAVVTVVVRLRAKA